MTSTVGRTDQFGNFLADRKNYATASTFSVFGRYGQLLHMQRGQPVCLYVGHTAAYCTVQKPIEMPFGRDSLKPKEPCTRCGAHWRRISGMLSSMSDRRQTDRVSLHWPPYSHSSRDLYDPYGGGDASCRYNSRSNLLVFYNSLLFVRCISTSRARWI